MKKMIVSLLVIMLAFVQLNSTHVNAVDDSYQPVPKRADTYPAYIKSIVQKAGKIYITADYIEWYEGAAADVVFNEREQDPDISSAPNGYYIINDNKKLRTFEVKLNAPVYMQLYNHGGGNLDQEAMWNEKITTSKFFAIFHEEHNKAVKAFPYHLTVKNGKITRIVQQFLP